MSNNVWNVPIEGWSMEQLRQDVERRTTQNAWPLWIVTANPEILLYARSHEDYASVLRQADVRTVDGFGLQVMMYLSGQTTSRITGGMVSDALLKRAIQLGWKVAVIGGLPGTASRARGYLEQQYTGISCMMEEGGIVSVKGEDDGVGEEARHRLTFFAPDILFIAFGHPKQEHWIARYLADFPSVKVVVGIGGVIDVWAGRVHRPPVWMRKVGLEWVWRLIQEPKRIFRIIRAVIIFPILFVIDKIRHIR